MIAIPHPHHQWGSMASAGVGLARAESVSVVHAALIPLGSWGTLMAWGSVELAFKGPASL